MAADFDLDSVLAGLASAHAGWAVASEDERVAVAEEIITNLSADTFVRSGEWVRGTMDLMHIDPEDHKAPAFAAVNRLLLVNSVKPFLTNYIAAAAARAAGRVPWSAVRETAVATPRGEATVLGPVPLGASAPGLSFEVWCEPQGVCPPEATARCSPGTVSVVLGAGNQNMLSIVDVLDRIFTHGECVLLKHHPLRLTHSLVYPVV